LQQWEYCRLTQSETGISYVLYQAGVEDTKTLASDEAGYNPSTWRTLIAKTGQLGWEAINIMYLPDGDQVWFFKRPLQPGNPHLEI